MWVRLPGGGTDEEVVMRLRKRAQVREKPKGREVAESWRDHRIPDCHANRRDASRKQALDLAVREPSAPFTAAVPTACCGWEPDCRRQTVCQQLEFILSFQSVKSKTETHWMLTATQRTTS